MKLVYTCILALTACPLAAAAEGMFVSPIGGTPYVDWTIVNYFDLNRSSGAVADYLGGPYSYDGHDAIDFTLPNFAAMDAGVSVNAAAAGIVTAVRDGEYDRWSRVNPNPGQPANRITIDHGGGITTTYLHLKKNSIIVSVGQSVAAGQKIAEVGSSGNSSDPHLHFSVRENNQLIETYLDPDRWWKDPLPYAGDVPGALDFGITNHTPTTEEYVNRPDDYKVFRHIDGDDQRVVLWALLHGISSGDRLRLSIFRPDGSLYQSSQRTYGQIRYGWDSRTLFGTGLFVPDVPDLDVGLWSVVLTHQNGTQILADSFLVVVPEPHTALLALAGSFFLLRHRQAKRRRSCAGIPKV